MGRCLGEVGGLHPHRLHHRVRRGPGAFHAGAFLRCEDAADGTAYAVWVGIGAALTVIYGMVTGSEPANLARILLIAGLVGCVIGLKLVDGATD